MPQAPLNKVYHVINIPEKEQEFFRELMTEWQKGKAIRAVGEAAKGVLSNPALGGLIVGGILAAIVAIKGKDVISALTRWYGGMQGLLDAKTPEEKTEAVGQTANALRDLIKFFSPLGPLTPLP